MEKLKIFISGTQDDMKPERDAVDRAVNTTTLSTGIRAETTISQSQSPRTWIEQQIRECNIYIGVYSHRYGWVIPEEDVSATEFEFNLARKLQKPILVWIRNLRDEEKVKADYSRQEKFLNRVSDFSSGHLRQVFDNVDELEKWVAAALGETFTEIIRRGTTPSTSKFLVPFPHNPDFVGREKELNDLHEMLQQKQSIVGIRPTVLVGLGGIGKTQLAVEYAHAHRDDYPSGVFWLNAINPLLFEFSDLAEKLEMSDRDTPRDKAARKVWDYLDTHPDALVIFDNVLEPSQLNVPFSPDLVPANLRCRTLFTTRQRDFPRTFQPFEVKILPEMAAMKLLLRSRPDVLEENHPEWGWARIVCAELGWLPLALELAASYLGEYPEVSITGYLERLRTEGSLETVDTSEVRAVDLPTRVEEILKAAAAGNLEIKHQVAVSATLQTQWKRLDDGDAKLLFRAAGQFPEASWIPIPRLGLLTGIESEAKAGRPSPLSVVLKKLQAVSLIEELSDDRLRLHPLVQEFAASLSPASFRMEMAERVVKKLNDLHRLQVHVIRYGIDIVLEDVRTGLGFCGSKAKGKTYSLLFNLERILDRQAYYLHGWNAEKQPALFFQQLHNESFQLDLGELQRRAETELANIGKPYLRERLKINRGSPELVRSLQGHRNGVKKVVLSANGQLAISVAYSEVKIWDISTGRELRTLYWASSVEDIALSADGQLAIFAVGYSLIVWDVVTGQVIRTFEGHDRRWNSVALSADKKLVIASQGHELNMWDIASGRELHTLIEKSGYGCNAVSLADNGEIAVYISGDGTVNVWQVLGDKKVHSLQGHGNLLSDVILSADGRLAVFPSDNTLKVWDVHKGRELCTLKGHSSVVYSAALSANGRLAVTASYDNTLKVWDIATGLELRTLNGHIDAVNCVAMSANGRLVVSASSDKTLKVWDISSSLGILSMPQVFLRVVADGQNKFKNCKKWGASDLGVSSDSELSIQSGHSNIVKGVALSADGRLAISASGDKTLKVWDVSKGRELCTLKGHNDSVYGVALSADGMLAISASLDKTLKVWDVATGRELYTLQGHSDKVHGVALTADGRLAISSSSDSTLKVWDVTTGFELYTFRGYNNRIPATSVVLSADGRIAISSSTHAEQALKMWNVPLGVELQPGRYTEKLRSIVLSADGRVAISTNEYKKFEVWDVIGKSNISILECDNKTEESIRIGEMKGMALNTDGRLAVATTDNRVIVWNAITGQIISLLPIRIPSSYCCAITPDAKIIVAGDDKGGVHFWELVGANKLLAKDVKFAKSWLALKKKKLNK